MIDRLTATLATWLVVYPVTTGLLLALEPAVGHWPVPLRSLLLSTVMVPISVLWAVPRATKQLDTLVQHWGRRGMAATSSSCINRRDSS